MSTTREPPRNPVFRGDLIKLIPSLRAFANSLAGRSSWTEDLVQETLARAWAHQDTFEPGTKLRSWLFKIMQNEFYALVRARVRESFEGEEILERTAVAPNGHLDWSEMKLALLKLNPQQRQAPSVHCIGRTLLWRSRGGARGISRHNQEPRQSRAAAPPLARWFRGHRSRHPRGVVEILPGFASMKYRGVRAELCPCPAGREVFNL
jgi:hypothetical protein